MVKTKELVICIISIIALVLAITTNVFATDDIQDLNALLGNVSTDENVEDTNVENIEENTEFEVIGGTNTNTDTNTKTNTSVNTNVNSNANATNTIPNTGVSYSSLVVIAIAAVSAIYAYKKIKEYNV